MTVRFCPQCGAKTIPQARFCSACGEALPGSGKSINKRTAVPSSPPSWQTLVPGLVVLSFYLLVGTGLWMFILRTQPFPTAAPLTQALNDTAPRGGAQTLAQNTPPVSLPEEAKKILAELADTATASPQDVNAWKKLAQAQFRTSQLDASYRSAALSSFKHVLELVPNDIEALRGVGNVYYDLEEFAKAKEYYEKYLALNPDDASVRTDLGTMYLYSNDSDRAISEYQTVIAKKPDFFQAYFNLGVAYHEKGDLAKAKEALTKAKSLTTDQAVRNQIDQVFAQFSGTPSTAQAAPPPAPLEQPVQIDPSLSPFQQAVEKLFRSHDIMGPRINRIEWSTPTEARVLMQNFPMSAMPPEVRERFLGKLRTLIGEAKNANGVSGTAKVELIDADSQQVMETLNS